MPKHCPKTVDDGGMASSYKARTYDAQIILNRNELGSKNPNTLHRLSKWGVQDAQEWRSYAYKAAANMQMRNGARVYEIGVGTGAFMHALQLKYNNLEIAGSDLSAQAVAIANQMLAPNFCYANAYDLSYAPADYYDFVIANGVFLVAAETESETINLVKQAVRLLKPESGRLFVSYNSHPIQGGGTTGDGRINLRPQFWSENAQLLKLTNITIVTPTVLGGNLIKYDLYANRAAAVPSRDTGAAGA
jgi:2-polyprenyl-3-methyl-5-hydroxy-6-metoxy-1,4-benzoquinol methylase